MTTTKRGTVWMLDGRTARDLMTTNPIAIPSEATVREAAETLTDHGISALAVVGPDGRPVGVLSRTDIVRHDRARAVFLAAQGGEGSAFAIPTDESVESGFEPEKTDVPLVGEWMTSGVVSVGPGTPAAEVIREMTDRRIHRLFVVDDEEGLVGVVSALDVLGRLSPKGI